MLAKASLGEKPSLGIVDIGRKAKDHLVESAAGRILFVCTLPKLLFGLRPPDIHEVVRATTGIDGSASLRERRTLLFSLRFIVPRITRRHFIQSPARSQLRDRTSHSNAHSSLAVCPLDRTVHTIGRKTRSDSSLLSNIT